MKKQRFYGDRCRDYLPDSFTQRCAAESYTCWRANCGCFVEIDEGETVFVDPAHPEGAWVGQGERGHKFWHYCPDIDVENTN